MNMFFFSDPRSGVEYLLSFLLGSCQYTAVVVMFFVVTVAAAVDAVVGILIDVCRHPRCTINGEEGAKS